ncbi:MAG: hypothetical protein P1V29_03185 [Gammaproteobacteria bacterium]|nr:hypothetical protein [Gammaproteobacteria bacterium]
MKRAITLGMVAACAALSAQAQAQTDSQSNYAAFELQRSDNWSPLDTQDMNGDGRQDLVYADYTDGVGRELVIHYQDASGDFPAAPQRIEIKSEIIAIGFGEVRSEPGTELILHAANGVFSLSASLEGYANNLQPLLRFDSLASIPAHRSVEFLPALRDHTGDDLPDLLLPQQDGFAFFRAVKSGADTPLRFEPAGSVDTVNSALAQARRNNRETGLNTSIGINAERGIAIDVVIDQANPFEDFVRPWQSQNEGESEQLLRSANWIPNAVMQDMNGDALGDLVFINLDSEALPQLNIALQSASGFDGAVSWQASMEAEGTLRFADLDGDSLEDFIRLSGSGSDWEAKFFRHRSTSDAMPFDFTQPDQVMRFDGYDVRLTTLPAPDGGIALAASYYTLPLVEAIRSASINRTQLLFAPSQQLALTEEPAEASAPFARRPTSQLVESFSAANVRGLSEQLSLQYDIDGDGNRDALYITERGTLAAKRLDAQLQIADEPFWEYVSTKTVFEFEVVSLNDDAVPDLLLRHGNATTVLVSRDE